MGEKFLCFSRRKIVPGNFTTARPGVESAPTIGVPAMPSLPTTAVAPQSLFVMRHRSKTMALAGK